MGDLIRVDTATPVRTIRIARPEKKNALTSPMYVRLVEALDAANADAGVRAICILGGEGMFTAGNDIQEFLGFAEGGVLGREVLGFLKALVTNGKPLVAGVDGMAVGVGTTMLLHCDHVVASTRAVFSTPFVNLGLVPEAGSSLLAPRLMGHVRAFELLAMARPFTAERALAAGAAENVWVAVKRSICASTWATAGGGVSPGVQPGGVSVSVRTPTIVPMQTLMRAATS